MTTPSPRPTQPSSVKGDHIYNTIPAGLKPLVTPATQPFPAFIKIIDLGEMSPAQVSSIMEIIQKAWGKEIAPMLNRQPVSFKDQIKSDFTNAAYRVGATQILNTTKNFFIQYARKSCSEESKVSAVIELLDTEIGTALMAMFIGLSVSQIPQLANNPKMQKILKEFRVGGMATIGNSAVEALVSNMLPVISSALNGLEKADPVRIENDSNLSLEEELIIKSESNTPLPMLRQS